MPFGNPVVDRFIRSGDLQPLDGIRNHQLNAYALAKHEADMVVCCVQFIHALEPALAAIIDISA